MKKHVYIIGSKGIPANYGGFETFVEKLTEYQLDNSIQYHIACMEENSLKSNIKEKHFYYNNAECFNINVPNIGSAKAIYYDLKAINYAINLAEKNKDVNPIFYILACRIGPFISNIKKRIENIGGKLYVNPDGHEWLRAKWSYPVRMYWKKSEQLMVKYSDLLVCDSENIEQYILEDYRNYKPNTIFIAYGTDTQKTKLNVNSIEVKEWFQKKIIKLQEYYLVVGRFVPENNYETMISEFMKSNTKKDLILITNIEKNKFFEKLKNETQFDKDPRIKFVGTVYDQELLKFIRENAFAYLHGHEVGGTNPSLLEALFSTETNLLLDVGFNREVGQDKALYWNKKDGDLKNLINKLDDKEENLIGNLNAKEIIDKKYTWRIITDKYENLFRK